MLTAAKAKQIHDDLDAAIQEVAKKHGLSVSPTTLRYNASTCKLTVELGDTKETGGIEPKFLNNLKRHGWKFGLTEQHLNKSFNHPSLGKLTFLGMSGTQKAALKTTAGKVGIMRAADVAHYFETKSV